MLKWDSPSLHSMMEFLFSFSFSRLKFFLPVHNKITQFASFFDCFSINSLPARRFTKGEKLFRFEFWSYRFQWSEAVVGIHESLIDLQGKFFVKIFHTKICKVLKENWLVMKLKMNGFECKFQDLNKNITFGIKFDDSKFILNFIFQIFEWNKKLICRWCTWFPNVCEISCCFSPHLYKFISNLSHIRLKPSSCILILWYCILTWNQRGEGKSRSTRFCTDKISRRCQIKVNRWQAQIRIHRCRCMCRSVDDRSCSHVSATVIYLTDACIVCISLPVTRLVQLPGY